MTKLPLPSTAPEDAYAADLGGPVAGIDEAGRGAWAGPVVAGAVVLPTGTDLPSGIRDSKLIAEPRREALFEALNACAAIGIGLAEVAEIDRMGVGKATYLAMARAVAALPAVPAGALVDGNVAPALGPCPSRALVRGDSLSLSIAAASIAAKVTRDRIMRGLHTGTPLYGWDTNKGYGAKVHQAGLAAHGVTQHHRRSFAPIKALLSAASAA